MHNFHYFSMLRGVFNTNLFCFLSSLISVTSFQLNYCNFFCADLHADLNCINTLMLTASIYLFSLGNATSVYILEHCNVMVHIKMKDCMRKIFFFAGAQLIQNGDNDVSYS